MWHKVNVNSPYALAVDRVNRKMDCIDYIKYMNRRCGVLWADLPTHRASFAGSFGEVLPRARASDRGGPEVDAWVKQRQAAVTTAPHPSLVPACTGASSSNNFPRLKVNLSRSNQ